MEPEGKVKSVLKRAFGFSDDQLLKEFEQAEVITKKSGAAESGDYEALKKKIEEMEKSKDSDQ